jgi:hypothetical protein
VLGQLDPEPGLAHLLDRLGELLQAGLGSQVVTLILATQDPDQLLQVGDGLAAGRLDRPDGGHGLCGVAVQQPAGHPAWMAIALTWWATTSCSFRAIRTRSSSTARRALRTVEPMPKLATIRNATAGMTRTAISLERTRQ